MLFPITDEITASSIHVLIAQVISATTLIIEELANATEFPLAIA